MLALPAFLTLAVIPLTFSIANGIAFGFIAYTLLRVFRGAVPAAFRLLEPGSIIAVMDSQFLSGLIGKRVRITAVDERSLPPLGALVLKEVSSLGIVAADERATRFFPWHEIVEIHPAAEMAEGELLGVDSEP